jgi:hypothetical protein
MRIEKILVFVVGATVDGTATGGISFFPQTKCDG